MSHIIHHTCVYIICDAIQANAMHKQLQEQASSQASMGVSMGRGQWAHHETVALAALDRRSFLTSALGAATLHT